MRALLTDLRDTLRGWRRRPGFVLAAVVSMGLGIGAGTAIFSVVHAVLLEPLPFQDPGRLYAIHSRHTSTDRYPFQLPEFCDHRDGNRTLQAMAAYAGWSANLTGTGDAERIQGMRATGNLFELLGTRASLGRTLTPADDAPGAERVVVLSHGLWARRFGGDPSILGRTLSFNAESYVVVGILPPDFLFPQRGAEVAVSLKPEADPWRHNRDSTSFLRVLGRARPGADRAAIQADLDAIALRLLQEFPSSYARKQGVLVVPWAEDLVRGVSQVLWVLQGTVAVLLLITCANVASLMLARAASFRRDFAVRRALGASAGEIFRRQMTEGVMLSLAGGAAGLLGAVWGVPALLAMAPPNLPRADTIGIRPAVLLFTLGVSVAAGLMAALLPAWRSSRGDLREDLAAGGRSLGPGRRARARWILVSVEVALLAVLLSTGGLLYRSFQVAQRVAPGFWPDTLTVRLSLPRARYGTIEKVTAFYRELESRVAALPGIREVSAANHVPLNGALASADYRTADMPTGSDARLPTATYRMVTSRYFRAMGIPLLAGRAFDEKDDTDAPRVAIISQALARQSFAGKDPVGQQILVSDTPEGFRPFEIVGVVGDIRHDSLESEPSPHFFVPYAQTHPQLLVWLTATQYLVVRASVDPMSLEPAIRKALREVDPDVAAAQVRTTGDAVAASIASRRFSLTLMGLFAAIATLMAAFGLHGVVSTSVAWRTREMALRMALGARPSQVRRLVLRQSAVIALAGGAFGLAASLAGGRLIEGLLFGVTAADPLSYASAILVLAAVVLVACDAPARRAARVAPAESLKAE
ncbi:MAG: ABC transporter permease [Candidatus Polarisedimenticolia bacterium]